MNLEFIEGRETRDQVVKFGGVGITDEEIVNHKGKRGGVCGGGKAWGWRFRSSRVG